MAKKKAVVVKKKAIKTEFKSSKKNSYTTGELIQFFTDIRVKQPASPMDSQHHFNIFEEFKRSCIPDSELNKHPWSLPNKAALDYIWKNFWSNNKVEQ